MVEKNVYKAAWDKYMKMQITSIPPPQQTQWLELWASVPVKYGMWKEEQSQGQNCAEVCPTSYGEEASTKETGKQFHEYRMNTKGTSKGERDLKNLKKQVTNSGKQAIYYKENGWLFW